MIFYQPSSLNICWSRFTTAPLLTFESLYTVWHDSRQSADFRRQRASASHSIRRSRRVAPPAARRLRPAQTAPRALRTAAPLTPSQPVTPHPSPRNPPDTDQFTASLCAVPPRRTHASSLNAESRRLTLHKEVPQNNELHLNIGRNTLQRFTEEIETIIASPYEFW